METLVKCCGNDEAPWAARVTAAQALLDRGWGRPLQPADANETRPLAGVPTDLLLRVLIEMAKRDPPVIEADATEVGSDGPRH